MLEEEDGKARREQDGARCGSGGLLAASPCSGEVWGAGALRRLRFVRGVEETRER